MLVVILRTAHIILITGLFHLIIQEFITKGLGLKYFESKPVIYMPLPQSIC